jgi:AcrR family transcriptional regulator
MGRRERRKLATRSELVRAGRELFGEKGLYDARIEDLADRAGIAKGTLYLYFRSKEELVQAVVEAGFDDLAHHVGAAVEGEHTLRERVGRIVDSHFEFFAANPDLVRVFHQARGILLFQRPAWLPLRRPLGRHLDRISRWLAGAPSPGQDRTARLRRVALAIFATVSGTTSVRAALGGTSRDAAGAAALRRGVVALALELAGGAVPASEKREGARRS